MVKLYILSDENCIGQVEEIFNAFDRLGYVLLFDVALLSWEQTGLAKGTGDETIWHFCQENNCLLITGNRTGSDGEKALEFVIRRLITPTSLPVLTIGNMKRVMRDRNYCIACAQRLADIIFEIDVYRGVTRLYLS